MNDFHQNHQSPSAFFEETKKKNAKNGEAVKQRREEREFFGSHVLVTYLING
jgi:hypothetical protein